jgi:tRNA-Thr(GGU) m(6)t(6)A37 methyltransferase TsaA
MVRPLAGLPLRRTNGVKETMEAVTYTPIGVLRTPFPDSKGIPKGTQGHDAPGMAELDHRYAGALAGLENFECAVLIFHMHLSEGPLLRVVPWNETAERGVFSTRSPRRPNPIGMTLVSLVRIECNVVYFTGADMVDGTPLLDIKPHIPE